MLRSNPEERARQLQQDVATKNSQHPSEDESMTATTVTDDECEDEDIFEDSSSGSGADSVRLVELNAIGEVNLQLKETVDQSQNLSKMESKRTGTSFGMPQSSTTVEKLKIHKGYDAALYEAGESSSEDSNKTLSTQSSIDLAFIVEYQTDEAGNVNYIEVDFNTMVVEKDMVKLMKKLRLNHYTAVSCEGDFTLSKCKALFERDYVCEVIENSGGSLSRHYPPRLIVPVSRKTSCASSERCKTMQFNAQQYASRVKKSVSSRVRTRFVAPVMLFDNKFICRSGTLSVRKTAVYETARQRKNPESVFIAAWPIQRAARVLASSLCEASNRGCKATSQLLVPSSVAKLRDVDAQIIRDLKIQYICDLMIEHRKMFKQAVRLSSSEKINQEIYNDCSIEQMPYPGCKLFKNYHDANHVPEGLVFDWNRSEVNIEMKFTDDPSLSFPDINWENYKEWDLVDLTKNYLKVLLSYLAKGHGGLLVHCISGWDRTPLFISILRASLWADGVIHESLNYRDLAYLTLAYDWYLFGHDLPNRLRKKQEIMHFCLKFLSYIHGDEFSVTKIFHELPAEQRGDRAFPQFVPGKREVIRLLSVYAQATYLEQITDVLE